VRVEVASFLEEDEVGFAGPHDFDGTVQSMTTAVVLAAVE
jgi:hypothetical protein